MDISIVLWYSNTRAPSQYPKRRLSVRSRKVSKPRDLYLELSDRYEIWQALRQQCCRCACQISKRYENLKYQSRGFETLRDLMERRLFGYWDGAQQSTQQLYQENQNHIKHEQTMCILNGVYNRCPGTMHRWSIDEERLYWKSTLYNELFVETK